MADNVLIATANDANGAHQKVVNEYLDALGVPVSVTAATPLPVLASISTAGLATSGGQTSGNSSLTSIDGKTPALGQALITASTPVVLPVSQVTALTPPAAITGFALEATAAALNTKIPSGLVVTTGRLQVELPAGGGGLTNTEIRATPLPISGTLAVSNFPATQAVSAAALPLPTGAATEAGNLATIKTNTDKIPVLGQALAAASTPVVLTAIQQSALTPPAAITGFNLEATQLLVKAKTDNIPAQGQALAAASLPVVLTAAQITTLTPPAQITGFALAANQQTNAITDAQIRATPLPISGTVSTGLSQPLTDTQLRATALPVTANAGTNLNTSALALDATLIGGTQKAILRTAAKGTTVAADTTSTPVDANTQALDVSVKGSIAVTGGLTDTQIRATPLPISGTVSTGGLTDTQIRATPLPVTMSNTLALTDTQLRASPVPVSGTISTINNSLVSTVNSTAVALAANAVFTGTSEDVSEFSTVFVTVFSDQASALDGLSIQQSSNGTNWDFADVYSIPIASGKIFSTGVQARFFRIVYTNGATVSTVLRLQTLYSKAAKKNSSVRPQDGRTNDNDFEEELSFLMGYNSIANSWNRVGVSNASTGGNENSIDRLKVNAALRIIDNAQPSGSKLVNVTGTAALGMDVNLKSVGITSASIAGNETTLDRLKVNASLRILDTSLPVGSQLVAATGTQALGLTVNTVDRAGRLLGVLSAGANTIGNVNINGTVPVSLATLPVTNAGTFAVQAAATLSAETTKVIGTVNISAAQTIAAVTAITNALPTGANTIGAVNIAAAQTLATVSTVTNLSQMGGVAISLNTGVRDTGTQRVTIATNDVVPVTGTITAVTAITNALPAGANTIGAVNIAAAQTLATVTTVSAVTAITNALPAGANAIGNINELRASTLAVTGTAASGTALTITLPAVAAQFHYITSIDIVLYSAAARTGAAAPTVVTTTNLPGAVAFTFSTAGAIGATDIQTFIKITPLKSSAVNVATTIVAPIATGGIWRITATYFTGA